jgi:quercetin dioxygenase-like cupin family protein
MTTATGETERFVLDAPAPPDAEKLVFLQPQEMLWRKLAPEMGAGSPELTVLHVNPRTGGTTLMIRTPAGFHVPRHWHSYGEKHTVASGTFILECEGRRFVMRPGSFNYLPAHVVHEAWTAPDEACVLFTDVEGPWDINWVDKPPGRP